MDACENAIEEYTNNNLTFNEVLKFIIEFKILAPI